MLCLALATMAQNKDKIIHIGNDGSGTKFFQYGKMLNLNQLASAVKSNSKAFEKLKVANTN